MNLMTYGVLAGAYKANNPKSLLTHACEVNEETFARRVLCGRVKLDSICDDIYAYTTEEMAAAPTCPVCLKRWHAARKG